MVKAWMRWVEGLARTMLGRRRSAHDTRPRRPRHRNGVVLEGLERREVLSGGVAAPFATLPGRITQSAQPAQITLHLKPVVATNGRSAPLYLGIDAEPTSGSPVAVRIVKIDGPNGLQFPGSTRQKEGPFITKIDAPADRPTAVVVDVAGLDDRVGDFVLNAFLPGDVNGDGMVDQTDMKGVREAYGSVEGQAAYNPNADFNRDGRVGCIDSNFALKNFGAHAPIVAEAEPPPAAPVPTQPTPVEATPVTPVAVAPVQPTPVAVAPVQAAPVVVAPVQAAPVVVAPVQPTPVVVAPVQPTPVVVAPIQPTPVAVTPVQATPVAVAPVQPTPVMAVPVDATQTVQTSMYSYGEPVMMVPVYAHGQPAGAVPVTGYNPSTGMAPIYGYGQAAGTVPIYNYNYTYGQPVVQGPVFAPPRQA